MNDAEHWDDIYASRSPTRVGWYRPHLETSLAWIGDLGLDPLEPIIDVGGGASTLVDDLLATGHRNLTVLDLSATAIGLARERLGEAAAAVTWLVGDVTEIELPARHYRLWHDRAVFHFLIAPEQQQKYRAAIVHSLAPGGYFVIGAFAPDAPPRCSGLAVQRYDADRLAASFGNGFELKQHRHEMHTTPGGVEQSYVYCLFQRAA